MKSDVVVVTSVPIDAAPADLLDRITVLEIKSERLSDDEQLRNVRAELATLRSARDRCIPFVLEIDRLTGELRTVNELLWELEEEVRRCEGAHDFSEPFVESARSIIHANNRRASLKRAINRLLGARYQEEKSYPLPDPVASEQSPRLKVRRATTRDPFGFFDVLYCINLDTRPDRWEQAMGEFVALGIADRIERVAAITHGDPREGCRLSHLECVQRAAAGGAETALIFEDDVVFPNFSRERLGRSLARLRTIPDWELFYLGGLILNRPTERYEDLLRASMAQTHAYAIHRRAFAAVERSDVPFDRWCSQTLKSYCAQPLLAWQRDGLSDIEGVSTSRATDARHTYAHFVAIPDADQTVREFVRRRFRFHILRVRLQRRLRRYLIRAASYFQRASRRPTLGEPNSSATPQPKKVRSGETS